MRRFVAILLVLLLAVPAWAATPRYVGTWLYGSQRDELKALRIGVATDDHECWGEAVNTDYEPFLEIRKHNNDSLYVTVGGAWEDTSDCAAVFMIGQVDTLVPTSGTATYDAILVLKTCDESAQANIAADGEEQVFMFRVRRLH